MLAHVDVIERFAIRNHKCSLQLSHFCLTSHGDQPIKGTLPPAEMLILIMQCLNDMSDQVTFTLNGCGVNRPMHSKSASYSSVIVAASLTCGVIAILIRACDLLCKLTMKYDKG